MPRERNNSCYKWLGTSKVLCLPLSLFLSFSMSFVSLSLFYVSLRISISLLHSHTHSLSHSLTHSLSLLLSLSLTHTLSLSLTQSAAAKEMTFHSNLGERELKKGEKNQGNYWFSATYNSSQRNNLHINPGNWPKEFWWINRFSYINMTPRRLPPWLSRVVRFSPLRICRHNPLAIL
mgnify:CR=1 FL=1